jgi:quinol monooxygenase YgiN
MPDISPSAEVLTVINVFTVSPENQARLVDLLGRATESTVRHVPGFISATLHQSLDGAKVTMHAQWRSWDDYQRMRENNAASPFLAEALTFSSFEPGFYRVVGTFTPQAARVTPNNAL